MRHVWLILAATACGSGGGDPTSNADKSDKADKAEPAKDVTFKLDDERSVKVTFATPAGWQETYKSDSSVNYQGKWMAKLYVGVTCHGSCDTVETAKKNIAAQAQEAFAFVKGKNHIPQLEPTWVRPLAESPAGVWSWRFDAVNKAEHQAEHQFSVDRILPGDPTSTKILTCSGTIDEREDAKLTDVLEQRCKDLAFEIVAKPKPKAK